MTGFQVMYGKHLWTICKHLTNINSFNITQYANAAGIGKCIHFLFVIV